MRKIRLAHANKVTLNAKKSNYVIFRPYQKKAHNSPRISIYGNETNKSVDIERKDCLNYILES